jgi:DNA-binding NarL/FixJ family response regulator
MPGDEARVLDALHRIALKLGDMADPEAVAELAARQARELLHADDVVVYIWDNEASLLRLAYGENSGHRLFPTMAAGDGAIGRAFKSGKPAVVTDYPNWEGAIPALVKRGVKRVAAVPLTIDRQSVGVLAVRFLGPRGCEPAHVRVLQLLGAPIAAMLDAAKARRHYQQLQASVQPTHTERAAAETIKRRLSVRERDVLTRLARGHTNRQIGTAIGLSPGTVKKHVEHILRKLAVTDRTQAAVRASELGLAERTDQPVSGRAIRQVTYTPNGQRADN